MTTANQLARAIERACHKVLEQRDTLNTLDAALGDGDSGLTAEKGAQALLEYLHQTPPENDLGQWLDGAGKVYSRAAPSTMGALVGVALRSAGQQAIGVTTLTMPLLAKMLLEADQSIQQRGRAKPGDKTIIDALHPAATAFAAAIERGETPSVAQHELLEAARQGRDHARTLRSQVGRAGWIGERTEGLLDPGTVLFVTMLEGVLEKPATIGSNHA